MGIQKEFKGNKEGYENLRTYLLREGSFVDGDSKFGCHNQGEEFRTDTFNYNGMSVKIEKDRWYDFKIIVNTDDDIRGEEVLTELEKVLGVSNESPVPS